MDTLPSRRDGFLSVRGGTIAQVTDTRARFAAGGAGPHLFGREHESSRLAKLLGNARNSRGGSLLLTGEPGVGKTALLDVATQADAIGMQRVRVDGFEAESNMPYAALQRLAQPLREWMPTLPDRHRQALEIAAGHREGQAPDRYLVGLGVLGLLAAAAEVRPVLCAVDDAHLLDTESLDALAFVGRRLEAEAVALLFAARPDEHIERRMAGIQQLPIVGLSRAAALELLRSSVSEPLDPAIAAQVVVATGGNPLALIDLVGELSAKQIMESSLSDAPFPVGQHLDSFYVRRVRSLSPGVQQWLLIAAADSSGNVDLIEDAAFRLGLPVGMADEAEQSDLVDVGATVVFRHPLVASAVYNAARGDLRRAAHRALAEASDALGMVEFEAWHAAKATLGTDAEVAKRLERVADLSGQRGGLSSRASVMVQASALTPEGPERYTRLVLAAEAALGAGAAQMAKTLLDDIDADDLDPLSRGTTISIRAHHALFTADPALTRAGADMLSAAACFRGNSPARERSALLQAFYCTLPAERRAEGATLAELGERLAEGARASGGPSAAILEGLSALILCPYPDAVPTMRRALEAIDALPAEELVTFGLSSVALTTALWDHDQRSAHLERIATAAREAGAVETLDSTLWTASCAELKGGTPKGARNFMDQVRGLRQAIGYDAEHVINVALLAWSDVPVEQVEMIAEGAGALGFGGVESLGHAALAVRDLAEGRYDVAFQRLGPLVEDPFLQVTPLDYPDYIEAGVRSGNLDEVHRYVATLEQMAKVNRSAWNRGVAERSRALVSGGDAEAHFLAAIDSLSAPLITVDLGRAHLLYGEWLRRAKRRGEATHQLRRALALFDQSEAVFFAQRARRELKAAGDTLPVPAPSAGISLTVQETTVARLASEGHTNAEIAATMFLSPNTVDYHLRKVFQKLGISSRRQLADRLSARS